ncbi:hypothetical protein H8K35_08245 [Undibacterium sp. LX40W]|uniref:Uncharacterized protein n=1 Tax=Undibacterium nitidum TaxID=2762298 RepID=A0A923HWR5_9BURK|nr:MULTISPECIES: hypothetical protein [Undibacterium]MBC3881576.1 hypothetical protein [Undibacterium nitidum]MBC3891642.1 hypothetical protein [Undibacterium sp. LX40W]
MHSARNSRKILPKTPIPFFSPLVKAIESMKQERATASHWTNTIKNLIHQGVSNEEIFDSEINSWLSLFSAENIIMKSDVLKRLNLNDRIPTICTEGKIRYRPSVEFESCDIKIKGAALPKKLKPRDGIGIICFRNPSFNYKLMAYTVVSPLFPSPQVWLLLDDRNQIVSASPSRLEFISEAAAMLFARQHASERFPGCGPIVSRNKWAGFTLPDAKSYCEYLFVFRPDQFFGYVTHFDVQNVFLHLRTSIRCGENNEKIFFIEELQSDWHAHGKIVGYGKGEGQVPTAPFQRSWHELGMRLALYIASLQNCSAIGWTTAAQQCARFMTAKRSGMERFYDNILPKYFTKLAKEWSTLPYITTISCRSIGHYLRPEGDHWRIFNEGKLVSTETFEYATRNSPDEQSESNFKKTPIHRLDLSTQMKSDILRQGIPLYGTWKK